VLPASTPLTASSDQSWLTITSMAGGTVGFAFLANDTGASRVAHVSVLGQPVTVTQTGDSLGSLTKSAGDGQSTAAGTLFPVALQVTVTDIDGNPLPGLPVTFTVTPGPGGAGGTFNATPPMPILTDQNGNAVAPALTANNIGGAFSVTATVSAFSVTFNLTNLSYTLGISGVTVGNLAGNGSILLLAGGPWTATSDAAWLTLSTGSQSGTGNAAIYCSYATNLNTTPQTGTLTISGLTFTVSQAGASFAPVYPLTTLISTGLQGPHGLAVDTLGNIYIADSLNNAIEEWSIATQQMNTLVSGLNKPAGVAVDGQGNVYFADSLNNAIKKWNAGTGQVSTLVSSGLSTPVGIAVDRQGNVYFADSGNNAIREWLAASGTMTTLISSSLKSPAGVALDAFGNLYIADSNNKVVKEWNAVSKAVTVLISSGLKNPNAVAVDGEGNVYVTDSGNNTVRQWNAATAQVSLLVKTGLNAPSGVAVGTLGNLYLSDTNANLVKKLTPGYLLLSATSLNEGQPAGADSATAQVFPPNMPVTATSNETWLTITGIAGGTVGFSFTANTSLKSRTAQIAVCGLTVTVTQSGDTVASIAKTGGTAQTALPGAVFAKALQVKGEDAAGQPVQGAPVTFKVVPGASGASGTFGSSPPMPILTNASGVAIAPALTAGAIVGTFQVSATAKGLTTRFTLTIAAP
jgi:streptogramin lyase